MRLVQPQLPVLVKNTIVQLNLNVLIDLSSLSCLTLFIPGKFTLLVQGAAPDPEVEQEHSSNREEQPPANAGITTVVIQRLPKNAMALYNSKNISVPSGSDMQHISDSKNELLKTRNCAEPVAEVTSQHHDIQNIDFTAMNLLASASTFQQGNL
jgi:hypothetical protein